MLEPWEHGTVARATRYPTYFDFNLVRVEEDPGMGVDALAALADRHLAVVEHRRLDFDDAALAEPLRAEFERLGWRASRLVWMRHEAPLPPVAAQVGIEVTEVPYDAAAELRSIRHEEDFPGLDPADHHLHAREISLARGARVLAVSEGGAPVGYAQLETVDGDAEITDVYVHPDRRGAGLGTALTRAAIAAADRPGALWIVADDEDRPKRLYARLGFRPAWTTMELLLPP